MAVASFTRRLKAADRLCTLTFDSGTYCHNEFMPMNERHSDAIRCKRISNNGLGTAMGAGLREVARKLNNRTYGKDRQTVVVVMSDGMPQK